MVVSLKVVHSTSGPKIIFPHILSAKRVWYIYIETRFIIFQFLFLLCHALLCNEPKLNFGRTKVADLTMIKEIKFTDFGKRATTPKMQPMEFRFHANSKVHSIL